MEDPPHYPLPETVPRFLFVKLVDTMKEKKAPQTYVDSCLQIRFSVVPSTCSNLLVFVCI